MGNLTSLVSGAGLCTVISVWSSVAQAHSGGIVSTTCDSCHVPNGTAELSLSQSPTDFGPGAQVTFTLGIHSPTIKVGGAYISTNDIGTLTPVSGEGLVEETGALLHNAPKAASGGEVNFRFEWQAPATPGAVTFVIAALAGNGDGRNSLDAPGYREFQFVFGCEGREYFPDSDRDGYGTADLPTVLACADSAHDQLALVDGDCDDYNAALNPGAAEICNAKDDNCNGQIDEGLTAVTLWPDTDGDGYYSAASGTAKLGCVGLKGYAALPGDCAPNDASIHPLATEVCNERDDNCDGQIDERVRPQCGSGWCRRDSATCSPDDCQPGKPSPEVCNLLDDDCNGVVDDGAPCGIGLSCISGACQSGAAAGGNLGATAGMPGMMLGGASGSSSVGGSLAGCGASACGGITGVNASGGSNANEAPPRDSHSGCTCGVAHSPSYARIWLGLLGLTALMAGVRRRL